MKTPVFRRWCSSGAAQAYPGEVRKFVSNLPELFDLSRPDRYEIQVEGWDPYTKKDVRSNISHIVVSAQ